jgi:hypothetical protein
VDVPDDFHLDDRVRLACAYEWLGRWSQAEGLHRTALARRRKVGGPDRHLLAGDLAQLAEDLMNQTRWSEAEPLLRECLAIRAEATPGDWVLYDAISLMGGALMGQGRYAESETLVLAGYEGVKAREVRIPVPMRTHLREAAVRVIHLYEEWDKPNQALAVQGEAGTCRLAR